MSAGNGVRKWTLGGGGLVIGLLIGYLVASGTIRPNPQERTIDADLWLQTSGEFRACCFQTYRLAGERLKSKLAGLSKEGMPPAVIMDLDETVLDNSPFQTWLYQRAAVYSDELWADWERDCYDEVLSVPGAVRFIAEAEQAGVAVVYVSNRLEKFRSSTIKALEHLEISTKDIDDRLLLRTDTSDKTERRKKVFARYRVLMLFGDNLRDFSEEFKAPKVQGDDVKALKDAIQNRQQQVDREKEHFGDDWFILPNPVYGEWMNLEGSRPVEVLRQARGMPR